MSGETAPSELGALVRLVADKVLGRKRAEWPYVGLEHLDSGAPFLNGYAHSSTSTSANGVFQSGDILFGKLRPYLRKSVGVLFSGYCSTDLLVLRPQDGVHPRFAAKVLQSEPVFAEAVATSIGTKMPRTSWTALKTLEVFAPPLPEQRRIAEILDTLDEAIRATEQVIAKLKQVKQGLLHDLLTRGIDEHGELRDPESHPEQFKDSPLGLVPREWDAERMGDCIQGTPQNGLYKPASYYGDEGTPIVRIDGFYDGLLAPLASLKRLRLGRQERETYRLCEGNILINRVNSIDFVGKAALVPTLEEDVVFESNMMRCRLIEDNLLPQYAILWLVSPWARHWFHRRAKSAIAQASVNQDDVKALWMPVPPKDEQVRCIEAIQRCAMRVSSETAELQKLRTLKHGLMDDLLTGRVRVSVAKEANP